MSLGTKITSAHAIAYYEGLARVYGWPRYVFARRATMAQLGRASSYYVGLCQRHRVATYGRICADIYLLFSQ